jgi:hypothetical protein
VTSLPPEQDKGCSVLGAAEGTAAGEASSDQYTLWDQQLGTMPYENIEHRHICVFSHLHTCTNKPELKKRIDVKAAQLL